MLLAAFAVGTCKTYHCFKGGPEEPPEGLETLGCPVYSHPAQVCIPLDCMQNYLQGLGCGSGDCPVNTLGCPVYCRHNGTARLISHASPGCSVLHCTLKLKATFPH